MPSARLWRLGVAFAIKPKSYRVATVAQRLDQLLGSNEVADRCRATADRLRSAHPLAETCDAIEQLPSAKG